VNNQIALFFFVSSPKNPRQLEKMALAHLGVKIARHNSASVITRHILGTLKAFRERKMKNGGNRFWCWDAGLKYRPSIVSICRKSWGLSLRSFVPQQQVMPCSTREMAYDNWRPSQSLLDSIDGIYHYAMNNKSARV